MMTAHGSVESVKEALRGGAFEYLEKPVDRDQLLKVVENALSRLNHIDDEIIGRSDEMERVKKMVLKVAASTSTVLIRGDSGVGKERVARAIHKASPRSGEIFQAVNCAAINENLLNRNCSDTRRDRLPALTFKRKGSSKSPTTGLSSLMRLGTSAWRCRPRFFVSFKSEK
jgi:DNA-binding NtrC family response regulator